jgi:hypothetical protein
LTCGGYRDLIIIQYDGGKKETASPRSITESLSCTTTSPCPSSSQPFGLIIDPGLAIPRDEVFTSYTTNYLLRGRPPDDFEVINKQHIDRQLTEKCFLALSTTFFGAAHKDKSILQQGFRRYGLALERIHKALGDSSRYRTFDLLKAVVVAAMFEVN